MLRLVFLLPIVEIILLVVLADLVSWQFVVVWLFAAAVLGVFLLRSRGLGSLRRARQNFGRRQMPMESMSKKALTVVAGILLIIPGVLSDVAALAILFPPTRRWLQYFLLWRFQRRLGGRFAAMAGMAGMASQLGRGMGGKRSFGKDEVIDVKVVDPTSGSSDGR